MSSLPSCPSCGGLVPACAAACPNCRRPFRSPKPRRKSLLLGLGGASLASITLMACYGLPPCQDVEPGQDPYSCHGQDEVDAGSDAGVDGGP